MIASSNMPIAKDGKNVYKINDLCLTSNDKTLLNKHHKITLVDNRN